MAARCLGRRPLLGAAAVVIGTLAAGCGFELRRPPELKFQTIRLSGFAARSPLAAELRSSIDASDTTKVVDSGPRAQVVLESLGDVRDKSVVASTAVGQVREFRLKARFNFRLLDSSGNELIPPTEIEQTRDLSYSESIALAKQQEEAFLYRSMQSDIVAQVMRRLASQRNF